MRVVGYLVAAPAATQHAVDRGLLPWAAFAALGHPSTLVRNTGKLARRLRARRGRSGVAASPPPSRPQAGSPEPQDGLPEAQVQAQPEGTLPASTGPAPSIRVVLVAVDPEARGRGVADALLGHFARTARQRGHLAADLSVAADNAAAHATYLRNGWVGERGADGQVARFRLDLSGPGAP